MAGGFGMGLAGLGGMYGGYQQAVGADQDITAKRLKNQDTELDMAGQTAAGNALRALQQMFTGGQPPGPPPPSPSPGQPSQPQQPPMQQGPPPGPPGAMPGAPGGPPGPPQAAMPPPQPPRPMNAPMPPPSPPGGGMQPPGGGQPPMQRPPGGQQQGPALDLQSVIAAVVKSNPGAPPQVIQRAVQGLLPLMNTQAQMQWREMSLALREQAILQRESIAGRAGDQRDRAMDQKDTALGQSERRTESTETRTGIQATAEDRRERQGDRKLDQSDRRLDQNDAEHQRKVLHDKVTADLALKKFQNQLDEAAAKNDIARQRTILQAMHMRAIEVIQAWGADNNIDKDKLSAILEENRKLFREQIDNLGKKPAPKDAGRVPQGSAIPGEQPAIAD